MINEEFVEININNKNYQVVIKKKKIKRVIIRVDQKNDIFVHCPNRCSFADAYKYLNDHISWVEKIILKQEKNLEEMDVYACINKQKIWFNGVLYNIIINTNIDGLFLFQADNLFIKENIDKTVEMIRFQQYEKISNEFNQCYASFKKYIKQTPTLEIKKMKSRWGSCNYKNGKIIINKMLVHVSSELLHFVMIHEFVHFIYPNHSKKFHLFLKECLPDYKTHEKTLKKFSFLLQI